MANDIFISYRRDGGHKTAKHLYDLLIRDGYTVSFDIDTLRSGDFDTELLRHIDECTDFILILNKTAFDRSLDPNCDRKRDWVRNELAYALEKNKNVIPIMINGFTEFPDNLPEDIAAVARKNGPKYDEYYFDDFYRKLKEKFLKTPTPKPFTDPYRPKNSGEGSRLDKKMIVAAALLIGLGIGAYFLFSQKEKTPTSSNLVVEEQKDMAEEIGDEPQATVTFEKATATNERAVTTQGESHSSEPPVAEPSVTTFDLGWGKYEGPMSGGKPHGFGGTITVKNSYTIDLKKASGETVQLNLGDEIANVKMENGTLRQGEVHFSDGTRRYLSGL